MTTAPYHDPSHRETLNELFDRLGRVQAASGTIKSLVSSQHPSTSTLADTLQALQRDLLLAAREAETARERITR